MLDKIVGSRHMCLRAVLTVFALAITPAAASAATITVTNTGDGAATCPSASNCTLRGAVAAAHSGDTISMSANTYTLAGAGGPISIDEPLTVTGAGSSATIITQSGGTGLFTVGSGGNVTFGAIQFKGGVAQNSGTNGGVGGALDNDGNVTLTNDAFLNDSAQGGTASGSNAGQRGEGGAVFNDGQLTISGTSFQGSVARGGGGASGNGGSGAEGGAIWNEGLLSITASTFDGSIAHAGGAGGTNTGDSGEGGAIYSDGGALTVATSSFGASSQNQADGANGVLSDTGSGGDGGAIASFNRTTLTGDTFTANQASGGTAGSGSCCGGAGEGGAVYLEDSSATVSSSTFASGDIASGGVAGGGAAGTGGEGGSIWAEDQNLTVNGGSFTGTSAAGGNGGASEGGGGGEGGAIFAEEAAATITGTTFTGAQAQAGANGIGPGLGGSHGDGGAIAFFDGTLEISGATFSGNSATASPTTGSGGAEGGAVDFSGGRATISTTTFTGNIAQQSGPIASGNGGEGGGLIASSGSVTLDHDSFASNQAPRGDGGGAYLSVDARLVSSTIGPDNTAADGAGVELDDSLAVVNSTIADNTATSDGGGIYQDGTLWLANATLDANKAGESNGGGNLYSDFGFVLLHDSLIAGGSLTTGGGGENCEFDSTPAVVSQGYNIEDRNQCQLDGTGDQTNVSNPGLGPLGANGGPTQTVALLTGSPAIDTGDPAGCTDDLGAPLMSDQRDSARPSGSRCDIGAFELLQATTPPPPPPSKTPQDSHLTIKPGSFAAQSSGASIAAAAKKPQGAKVSYQDTEAAKTNFVVVALLPGFKVGHGKCSAPPRHGHKPAHAHACTRSKSVGKFGHQDVAGANSFHFTGRVSKHKLARGRYSLQGVPVLGSKAGKVVSAKFKII